MEQVTKPNPEEFLGFRDQCRVICLEYASSYGGMESIEALRNVVHQELTINVKKDDLQGFIDVGSKFTKSFESTDFSKEKLLESLDRLKNSLDQETFNECADSFINPPVESWEKVSMILHLIYKACEQQGPVMVGTVIQIGVRYMAKTIADFVLSEGGWSSFGAPRSQEEQGDISTSIVVVPQSDMQEVSAERVGAAAYVGDAPTTVQDSGSSAKERSLSPKIPTPLDMPSPVNTDDERDSLATPPEIVERPVMTESYMRAMGGDDERRESNGSTSNGFEIIGSRNEVAVETQSVNIDDVQAFEQAEEAEPEPVESSDTQQQSEESVSEAEESLFRGYLPHISIGIAAAAAAGFFVLRRNM